MTFNTKITRSSIRSRCSSRRDGTSPHRRTPEHSNKQEHPARHAFSCCMRGRLAAFGASPIAHSLRRHETTLVLDEAHDLSDPVARLEIGEHERPLAAHALGVALHNLER